MILELDKALRACNSPQQLFSNFLRECVQQILFEVVRARQVASTGFVLLHDVVELSDAGGDVFQLRDLRRIPHDLPQRGSSVPLTARNVLAQESPAFEPIQYLRTLEACMCLSVECQVQETPDHLVHPLHVDLRHPEVGGGLVGKLLGRDLRVVHGLRPIEYWAQSRALRDPVSSNLSTPLLSTSGAVVGVGS